MTQRAQSGFLTDIKKLRVRARPHIEQGAVTTGYGADRGIVVKPRNEALATAIVCVLRHRDMASGISAKGVAAAFLQHADQSPFGFAHLLSALDFMQRGPLEIVFTGERAQSALWPLLETVHRAYLPARVLALAEDVPIGAGRHPVDGQPAAYVCRNRTGDAPVTTVEALRERCAT